VAKPLTIRIKTDGFQKVVDAMGGVTVTLPTDMSGMNAVFHDLDPVQALRFVRDRTGSDDFFRQGRAQIFLKGAMKKMINRSTGGAFRASLKHLTIRSPATSRWSTTPGSHIAS
jgi:anionic cell wall polymer biosynthesis LytR-Cps2A-Psr (LCP) family protein